MIQFNEAIKIILGDKPDGYYPAGFFFAFLAILLSLVWASKKRDVDQIKTPRKFSWSFLIGDNIKRITCSMIVIFLLFRLFDFQEPALMIGVGFGVAFGLDRIIQFLIDKTDIMNFLLPPRKSE